MSHKLVDLGLVGFGVFFEVFVITVSLILIFAVVSCSRCTDVYITICLLCNWSISTSHFKGLGIVIKYLFVGFCTGYPLAWILLFSFIVFVSTEIMS